MAAKEEGNQSRPPRSRAASGAGTGSAPKASAGAEKPARKSPSRSSSGATAQRKSRAASTTRVPAATPPPVETTPAPTPPVEVASPVSSPSAPAPPAAPPPPPPPGRTEPLLRPGTPWAGRLAALALVAVIGVVISSFTGGSSSPPLPAASALGPVDFSSTPPVSVGPPCPAATPQDSAAANAGITSLFIPPPPGFTAVPDGQDSSGPLSADALSRASDNPELARQALVADGYAGGFRRIWEDRADGLELHILLLKFTCAAGADNDVPVSSDGSQVGLPNATPLSIEGIPNHFAVASAGQDANGAYEQVVIASASTVEMRVWLFSATRLDASRIAAVANSEYNALWNSGTQ